jgi:hypothetical protein
LILAITNIGFQSSYVACSTEPSDQPACQYALGHDRRAVTPQDDTPSAEARGFCDGSLLCGDIGPNTFAPGQNLNRDILPSK